MGLKILQNTKHTFLLKLLKGFLKLILILFLVVAILFLASKFIEQKIVEKAINVINKELEVPAYVEKVSFSLLKKFPYASLQLNNVTILSAEKFNSDDFSENNGDTLIFLRELYLSVNIISLIDNRLEITRAYAQNGQVNIFVDKSGKENYKIFNDNIKKETSKKAKKDLFFMLNQIQLKQVELRFINKFKNTGVSIYAPIYTLKGEFYKKNYQATTSGKLLLNYFEQGQFKVHPERPATLNMNLNVNNNKIEIIESSIETKEFQFITNGNITFSESINLDLKITGSSNNLEGFIGMLTDKNPKTYSTSGQLGVSAVIKGKLDNIHSPAIAVNFNLEEGEFRVKKQGLIFDRIKIQGSYSNGDQRNSTSSRIDIENFFVVFNNSSLSGQFSYHNFNKPFVAISAKTVFQLTDLKSWISKNSEIQLSGKIEGELYCKGYFDIDNKNLLAHFQNWQKKGFFTLTNGEFKMRNPQLNIDNLSGDVEILNNGISFSKVIGNVQTSNIIASANIDDYYTLLIDSLQPMNIYGEISADQISYSNFKPLFETESTDSEGRIINVKCRFETDKFLYEKLIAEKVKGNLNYFNDQLQLTDLNFKALEGVISGQMNYIPQRDNKYLFQTHTITNHVNIKALFTTFNNFEQTFVKSENIDGYLTSNFDLEMLFLNGTFDPGSIELLGHARIDNGKLLNFEPIREVSKYSDINELNHIEFSKLENDILISKSTVHIPKMEITSNAFDLSIYGTQQFSGDYEYHMRVYLSDFMEGKSKRLAKQQTEFGYVEDDGYGKRTLFLVATSKNNISKVNLDVSEIKGSLKSGIKDEKKEFKKALHDEFGWFKNDTTLKDVKKVEKKPVFIIEWDEE